MDKETVQQLAEDEQLEQLIAQAIAAQARFWDHLSSLEQYVGTEFDSSVLDGETAMAPRQPRISDINLEKDDLQHIIQNGFGEAVVNEEGVGVSSVCGRCGASLDDEGYCTSETCPFDSHQQDCPKGWTGHSEKDPRPNDDTYILECTCTE